MRTDPDQIYNAKVMALVCSACFGGMLFGWDTGAIGGVLAMDATRDKFGYLHKSKTDKSNLDQNIVSTLQAGCFAACFVTSWFADRFGRRWSLIGSGIITTIGVVFQAASAANGTLALMYVGRFVAGLGVGAASTLTPLYVSECVPRAIRGGLTGTCSAVSTLATPLSIWLMSTNSFLSTLHRPWHYDRLLGQLWLLASRVSPGCLYYPPSFASSPSYVSASRC